MSWRQRMVIGVLLLLHGALAWWRPEIEGVDRGPPIMIGAAIAQLNLIALWAALSPGAVVQRLPWALLLTVLLWCVYVQRGNWDGIALSRGQAGLLGWILLGGVMAVTTPMWIARGWQRWRLVPREQLLEDSRRFDLRQMLIGITLLCVAAGLGRRVLPPGDNWINLDERTLGILLPMAVIANLVTALPTVWLSFLLQPRLAVLVTLAATLAYALAISIAEAGVLALLLPGVREDIIVILWILNAVEFWTIGLTLLALRAAGFRLVRSGNIRLPASSVSETGNTHEP